MILFFNKWIIVIPNEVRNLVKILRHCVPQNDKARLFDNLLFYDIFASVKLAHEYSLIYSP